MGKVEIDMFSVSFWEFGLFLQKCLLSTPLGITQTCPCNILQYSPL